MLPRMRACLSPGSGRPYCPVCRPAPDEKEADETKRILEGLKIELPREIKERFEKDRD